MEDILDTSAGAGEGNWSLPASRRTEIAGFRIYRDQNSKLSTDYKGKSSELIRLLLDKFFSGELPDVEMKLKP